VIQSPWGSRAARVSGVAKSDNRTLQPDANGQIILVTLSGGHYHLVAQ